MKQPTKGILIVNLGTPNEATVPEVRRYLDQFLMDGRVIDIPLWRRNFLVRGIIIPARVRSSTKLYQAVWDEKTGSPLMYYSLRQQEMLQSVLGDDYHVELAMRYQNPSIESALENLKNMQLESIRVIPLFPQYASATTGSIIEEVMRIMNKWHVFPSLSFANDYYDNDLMIETFADHGRRHNLEEYDHVLISYHGLPVRQLNEVEPSGKHNCAEAGCEHQINRKNRLCYVAQCCATSRAIAAKMGITEEDYTVCYQSRLGSTPWIQPYTSDVLKRLAAEGKKKLLVFSPAFVADCIETIYEIGTEYEEEYQELGGEKVQLVESLNDDPKWIEVLRQLALNE